LVAAAQIPAKPDVIAAVPQHLNHQQQQQNR
jgi:hypothetical protein